jgi:O-antigen/teichoic acid export membrane protein
MRFANIAIMATVARLVVPHDFGVFAVAITVHAVVSSIGELGVSSVLMRGNVDPDEVAPTVVAISVLSSLVLGGVMVAFARPIAAALGAPDAAAPVRVLALSVVLVGVFAVPSAELVRDFRQDRVFLGTVAGFVPGNAMLILLAAQGGGAMSFAWSRVVGQVVTGAVVIASVGHYYWPAWRAHVARSVLRFGLPLAGANLVGYTLLNTDYALVGHQLGPVKLGLYMLAFNIASWPTSLMGSMINSVGMPAFSRIRNDTAALHAAIFAATRALTLVALPICALTMALARPLVETVYGPRWTAAAPVLWTLSLYGAVSIACLLFSNLLVGQGHPRLTFLVQLGWLGALVPAMIVGVDMWGIVGAGVAHLVVILGFVLPAYTITMRRRRLAPTAALSQAAAVPLAAALAAAGSALATAGLLPAPAVKLLAGGTVGMLVYGIATSPVLRHYLDGRLAGSGRIARLARGYDRLGVAVGSAGQALMPGRILPGAARAAVAKTVATAQDRA